MSIEEIDQVRKNASNGRQRNFFIGCLAISMIVNLLLAMKIFSTNQKIIMVPGITKELIIDDYGVSRNYLEEAALLYTSALLDMTPSTIAAKKKLVLKHVSHRSSKSLKLLKEYFAKSEENYKKFNLHTFFAPKKMEVNGKLLEVVIDGILTSSFGKRGMEERYVKYKISFDYSGHYLYLKEFVELKDADE